MLSGRDILVGRDPQESEAEVIYAGRTHMGCFWLTHGALFVWRNGLGMKIVAPWTGFVLSPCLVCRGPQRRRIIIDANYKFCAFTMYGLSRPSAEAICHRCQPHDASILAW